MYKTNKSEAIHLLENSALQNRGYLYKKIALDLNLFKTFFQNFCCSSTRSSYIKLLIL